MHTTHVSQNGLFVEFWSSSLQCNKLAKHKLLACNLYL